MIAAATVTSAAIATVRKMMSRLAGREELAIGRERRLVDDQAGELVEREEALDEQREERADIDDAEPEERRAEQKGEQQPRVAEQEIGERARDAAALALDRPAQHGLAHGASSACTASAGHVSVTRSPCAAGRLPAARRR